jgi:hypothetical protein
MQRVGSRGSVRPLVRDRLAFRPKADVLQRSGRSPGNCAAHNSWLSPSKNGIHLVLQDEDRARVLGPLRGKVQRYER